MNLPAACEPVSSLAAGSVVQEHCRQWETEDGTCLACHEFLPAAGSAITASVLAVHGLGGAGTDFRPLGAALCPAGAVVYAPDLRGQGNDPVIARRGNIRDLREVVRDLDIFADDLIRRHPEVPFFIYGESMGAVLALHLAANWQTRGRQFAGLILASPVIDFEVPLSWWRRVWFNALVGVAPQFRLPMRGLPSRRRDPAAPPARVTRDETYTAYLRTAPHRLLSVTPRFLHSLLGTIRECRDLVPVLQIPVLILYAGHDIFIKPARVEAVFERLGSRDKTCHFYAESYHLLLHDHDHAQVQAIIRAWVAAHLP